MAMKINAKVVGYGPDPGRKTDFAMSRPIVVTACMSSSSESWEP
jgi:hypothetical protein